MKGSKLQSSIFVLPKGALPSKSHSFCPRPVKRLLVPSIPTQSPNNWEVLIKSSLRRGPGFVKRESKWLLQVDRRRNLASSRPSTCFLIRRFLFSAALLVHPLASLTCLASLPLYSDELCQVLYTTGDGQQRVSAEQQLAQITSNQAYITQARSVLGKPLAKWHRSPRPCVCAARSFSSFFFKKSN